MNTLSLLRLMAVCGLLIAIMLLATTWDPRTFVSSFEERENKDSKWQVDADPACRMESSSQQVREGNTALRIRAPKGLRCELVPRIYPVFQDMFFREPFSSDRWYRFSIFVDDLGDIDDADDLGDNTIVAQWHSSPDPFLRKEGGRGPPLALRIFNGTWGITYGWDGRFRSKVGRLDNNWHWAGRVETGRWIDWTFHVVWSYKDDGITEIWRDSELILQRSGPNTYNDLRGVYLKLGLYHPTDDQIIFLDSVSIENGQD